MNCPECGGVSEVLDSRPRNGSVWRRRGCRQCGARWTTMETANPTESQAVTLLVRLGQVAVDVAEIQKDLQRRLISRPSGGG